LIWVIATPLDAKTFTGVPLDGSTIVALIGGYAVIADRAQAVAGVADVVDCAGVAVITGYPVPIWIVAVAVNANAVASVANTGRSIAHDTYARVLVATAVGATVCAGYILVRVLAATGRAGSA
jgi:hypothetical protein